MDEVKDEHYYRANRHLYYFPKFTLDTKVGLVEFVVAIPRKGYDPFAILELFDKYPDVKKAPD